MCSTQSLDELCEETGQCTLDDIVTYKGEKSLNTNAKKYLNNTNPISENEVASSSRFIERTESMGILLVDHGTPISSVVHERDPLKTTPVLPANPQNLASCSPTTQPEVLILPDVKTTANNSPFWESEPSTSSQGRIKPADYTPFRVSLMLNANALPEVIENNPNPQTPENPTLGSCSQNSRVTTPDSNHGPTVYYSKELKGRNLLFRNRNNNFL